MYDMHEQANQDMQGRVQTYKPKKMHMQKCKTMPWAMGMIKGHKIN